MDRYLVVLKDALGKNFHVVADNVRDLIEVILVAETHKYLIIAITMMVNSYTASGFFKFIQTLGKDDIVFGGQK